METHDDVVQIDSPILGVKQSPTYPRINVQHYQLHAVQCYREVLLSNSQF